MIQRLSQFIKNQEISVRSFEQKISASDGMIRRAINNNTDIQSKWIANIAENYPNLNIEWLLTGKGEMLKTKPNCADNTPSTPAPCSQIPDIEYKDNNKNADLQENSAIISQLLTTIQELNRTIGRLELRIEQLEAAKKHPSKHYQCA